MRWGWLEGGRGDVVVVVLGGGMGGVGGVLCWRGGEWFKEEGGAGLALGWVAGMVRGGVRGGGVGG